MMNGGFSQTSHMIQHIPQVGCCSGNSVGGSYTNTFTVFLHNRLSQQELQQIVDSLNALLERRYNGLRIWQILPFIVLFSGFIIFAMTPVFMTRK